MVAGTVDMPPFIVTNPKLTVGPVGSEVEYECGANQIDATPEQGTNDTETFCGIFTSYKPTKWTVTVTALQSFGATGFWNLLRPLVNTTQPFQIIPDRAKAIGPDNVAMSGTAFIPEFAYLTGAVGEASEFDFVLAVQGDPDFLDTPGGAQTESTEPPPA